MIDKQKLLDRIVGLSDIARAMEKDVNPLDIRTLSETNYREALISVLTALVLIQRHMIFTYCDLNVEKDEE